MLTKIFVKIIDLSVVNQTIWILTFDYIFLHLGLFLTLKTANAKNKENQNLPFQLEELHFSTHWNVSFHISFFFNALVLKYHTSVQYVIWAELNNSCNPKWDSQ